MKIKKIKLKNFRGYKGETLINLEDLTVFVGKNDVGKSTILEALDIFINEGKGVVKFDEDDVNKNIEPDEEVSISVVFYDFPASLVIDETNPTSLESEYLLNADGDLEIVKKYLPTGNEKVYIRAQHPTGENVSDLLLKKITELRKILDDNDIRCDDRSKSAVIRRSIWEHFNSELELDEIEVDVTKEDAKNIWIKLKTYMPIYALFQSDRKNKDGDSEVQDPMKIAVQEVLKNEGLLERLNSVAEEVEEKLRAISNLTLDKIRDMNPEIAESLNPVIPDVDKLKWADVFKSVSIASDNIPLNKRGSGVRRLILLNFFRAEAERRAQNTENSHIIYAIEEPETSQHLDHQRKLIDALKELSESGNAQVILTTHAPAIVKMLNFSNLRVIKVNKNVEVVDIDESNLPYQSINEVSYLAFDESDEEYHNELFARIEVLGLLDDFKQGKAKIPYTKMNKDGSRGDILNITLSEKIRHQIHHPENVFNDRFTFEELQKSIKLMRDFLRENNNS